MNRPSGSSGSVGDGQPPRPPYRRLAAGVAVLVAILLIAVPLRRQVDGLALVVRAANLGGLPRRLANLYAVRTTERLVDMPMADGAMPARVYVPVSTSRQTVLLVSGLHPAGMDEPRLAALATTLAAAGVTVVTPRIPELERFAITPALTDRIEEIALWLATTSGLTPSGRIGLMGISFSGGLAIVAAGRPSLRDRLLYVFSFGGHDDLPHVLEYLCTGVEDDADRGTATADRRNPPVPPPHDYGVAVVLLNVADHVVPPEQVPALREAVRRFLRASYLDVVNKPEGQREFAALRELAPRLPEPSRTLLTYVNSRDVARLGPLLPPHIASHADPPALSPSRSPLPQAAVFLLHGRGDNVIPARESQRLAHRLEGRAPVRLLMTDLISHVDAGQSARVADVMRMAAFWGDLLAR